MFSGKPTSKEEVQLGYYLLAMGPKFTHGIFLMVIISLKNTNSYKSMG